MTYILNWPDRISIFLENFVIYFIKNFHSKVKFEAKNDLLKVGDKLALMRPWNRKSLGIVGK